MFKLCNFSRKRYYFKNSSYDALNRLIGASGGFGGGERQLEYGNDASSNYDLEMTYTKTHSIETKTQNHEKNGELYEPNTYKNNYKLQDGTHRVEHVVDDSSGRHTTLKYDLNGNITHRGVSDGGDVDYYWDEVNRLRVVADRFGLQHHIYDGAGERVLKATTDREAIYENGALISNSVNIMGYTTYPSAHLVVDKNGIFSKHYYVGTQRIVSRLGDESARIFEDEREERPSMEGEESTLDEKKIKNAQKADLQFYADQTQHKTYTFAKYSGSTIKEEEQKMKEFDDENTKEVLETEALDERPIYFYHPDHLGTTNALTDANGTMYQFFLNLPFGESMAEQSSQSYYKTPFKFNGKELDESTGMYYYGARYYDPSLSIWMSVDPLAEQFPTFSPYNYTMNNPINMVDPDGRAPDNFYKHLATGRVSWKPGIGEHDGYENLGTSWGSKDVHGNKLHMNGNNQTITYRDSSDGSTTVLYDYNAQNLNSDGNSFSKWFYSLFDNESEGIRIWGNSTGGESTADDGVSKGSLETKDIPSVPGGANLAKVRNMKISKNFMTNARNLAKAINGGLKDANKASHIITKSTSIFSNHKYEIIIYAIRGDGKDPVIWIHGTDSQFKASRDSTRIMNEFVPNDVRSYHGYYRDSVRTRKSK